VLLVALTGGIGSGKSLAAEFFAACGAEILDFDQIARDVVERGSDGLEEIVLRFGDGILLEGGLNRALLAELIFGDAIARKDLEAITHPRIRAAFDRVVATRRPESILVCQIPLLVESDHFYPFDFIVAVSAALETRRARLVKRGMKGYQVEQRIAAQATDEERAAIADAVLENDGSEDELLRQVENLYQDRLYPARMGIK
jgi:dephospho-CoA kinase